MDPIDPLSLAGVEDQRDSAEEVNDRQADHDRYENRQVLVWVHGLPRRVRWTPKGLRGRSQEPPHWVLDRSNRSRAAMSTAVTFATGVADQAIGLNYRQRPRHVVERLLDEFPGRCQVHAHVVGSTGAVRMARIQEDLCVLGDPTLNDRLGRDGRA